MTFSKSERLEEFLRRLDSAHPVATFDEAYALICDTINAVENEMTSIPFDPINWQTDGRMYPPQLDNVRDVEGRMNLRRFRTRMHNVFIADSGAILIMDVFGYTIQLNKRGADGEGIEL